MGNPVISEHVGTIELLGIKAWHCPDSVANVVSISDLHREGCDMQLVTDDRNLLIFRVTFPTGGRYLFRQDLDSGMYVFNLNDFSRNLRYSFLSTVKGKTSIYPSRGVCRGRGSFVSNVR